MAIKANPLVINPNDIEGYITLLEWPLTDTLSMKIALAINASEQLIPTLGIHTVEKARNAVIIKNERLTVQLLCFEDWKTYLLHYLEQIPLIKQSIAMQLDRGHERLTPNLTREEWINARLQDYLLTEAEKALLIDVNTAKVIQTIMLSVTRLTLQKP